LRQVVLVATLVAFAPAAYVAASPSEVGRWSILAAFGSLFAAAFALVLVDPTPVRQHRRGFALAAVGGLAILTVPLHNAAGAAVPDAVDAALLILGTALIAAGGYPFRGLPAAHVPWLAALPGLVALSAATAAGLSTGPSAVSAGTWGALMAAVAASAALHLRARWVDARVAGAVRQAEEMASRRDYRGAILELDRATRLTGAKGSDAPWYSKGAALVVLGQYEEAMACIDTALKINPRNEVAWVNKGNALVRMARPVDALRCYNSAIKVNPRYEVAWNNKGNALARLGKFEDALRCYERALAIDGSYRGAWVNKGYVLTKLGDFDAAAKCADEALRLAGAGGVPA
jgi:tetratricopeptide (TPR) repeat protein